MKNKQKGFIKALLITVVVIILIFVTLFLVVFKSLDSARNKSDVNQKQDTKEQVRQVLDRPDVKQAISGAEKKAEIGNNDSKLKSLLSEVRTEAENIYNSKTGYTLVCSSSTHLKDINLKVSNMAKCVSTSDYYIVEVPLSSGSFCLDSAGYLSGGTAPSSGKKCLRN